MEDTCINEGANYTDATTLKESDIELDAYRVIRQFTQAQAQCEIGHIISIKNRDIQDRALGNFVRGVVALQGTLYNRIIFQNRQCGKKGIKDE